MFSWRSELVWPYSVEIDLLTYRVRGNLPSGTPNPYLHMWLFDDRWLDHDFLNRHRGKHPQQTDGEHSEDRARAISDDFDRWITAQRDVLAALRRIATEVRRELEAGAGMEAFRRCQRQVDVLEAEHRPVREEITASIVERRGWPIRYPAPWTEQARIAREVHRRNSAYGGGASSG